MADRLQKTIQDLPEKTVASRGRPLPPDTQTAEDISQVGAMVGSVIKEKRISETEDELRILGSEVLLAQKGGDLRNTTDRFKLLKKAQEQGKLSDSMINIETEKLIKEISAKSPGFAQDVRQQAASILGFDPTGSQVQGLFGKSGRNRPSTPATQQEKMMEKAEALAAGTGTDPHTMYNLIAKSETATLQKSIVAFNASQGTANATEVFRAHQLGLDTQLSGALGAMSMEIQQGSLNPTDTVALRGRISELQQKQFIAFQKDLPAGTTVEQISNFRKSFDTSFEQINAAIDNGTLEGLLTSQKNSYSQVAAIAGYEAFPGLAAIGASPLGQAGVDAYFKAVNSAGSEKQLKLMAAHNPVLAEVIDQKGLMAKKMSDSFQRVTGVKNADNTQQQPPLDEVDVLIDDMTKSKLIVAETSPVVRDAVLERSKANGQFNKDMSMYAQPKARGLATEREVKYVTENFPSKLEAVVREMQAEMAGRDDIVLTMRENGTIKVDARFDMHTSNNFLPFKQDTSGRFKANVRRLETYNKLMTNGWAKDLGKDPSAFLGRTLENINTASPDVGLAPLKPSRRRYNPATSTFEDIQ